MQSATTASKISDAELSPLRDGSLELEFFARHGSVRVTRSFGMLGSIRASALEA